MYVSLGVIFSSVLRPNPPPGSQYLSLAGEIAKRNVDDPLPLLIDSLPEGGIFSIVLQISGVLISRLLRRNYSKKKLF